MEKLIKLLNEYNYIKEDWFVVDDGWWEYLEYDEEKEPMLIYQNSWTYASWEDAESILISRQYWFIEWLVNNDRVDLNRIPEKIEGYYHDAREYVYDEISILLMELAFQDDPLEFLILILK